MAGVDFSVIMNKLISSDINYPTVQEVGPINPMLNYGFTITPQISSGLPTTTIAITDALVAELMRAEPMVKENFTFVWGMARAFIPMPTVGRNMFDLGFSIINGVPEYSKIYSFIELMSNANSLILCRTDLEGPSTRAPQKLVMKNSAIYQRPSFLGIVAGATEAQEVVERLSILGSIDFNATTIGDNISSLVGTLGNALGLVDAAGNIL